MKKLLTLTCALLIAILVLPGCEKVPLHTLKLSDKEVTLDDKGGEKIVTGNHDALVLTGLLELDANMSEIGRCTTISREEFRLDWLTVKVEGNKLMINAAPNDSGSPRFALVAVCSKDTTAEELINIKQK